VPRDLAVKTSAKQDVAAAKEGRRRRRREEAKLLAEREANCGAYLGGAK
jgi:hypothetical protein